MTLLGVNIYYNNVITTKPAFGKEASVLNGITIEDANNGFSIGTVTWTGAGSTVLNGDTFIAYKTGAVWQSPRKVTLT